MFLTNPVVKYLFFSIWDLLIYLFVTLPYAFWDYDNSPRVLPNEGTCAILFYMICLSLILLRCQPDNRINHWTTHVFSQDCWTKIGVHPPLTLPGRNGTYNLEKQLGIIKERTNNAKYRGPLNKSSVMPIVYPKLRHIWRYINSVFSIIVWKGRQKVIWNHEKSSHPLQSNSSIPPTT